MICVARALDEAKQGLSVLPQYPPSFFLKTKYPSHFSATLWTFPLSPPSSHHHFVSEFIAEMKNFLRRLPVLSHRQYLKDTFVRKSHALDSSFHGWFEREAKDERHRLQLASFLFTLYEAKAPPDLMGHQQRNNHHPKWLERLDESNLLRFLDDCVNKDHIVEGALFHEALVLAEQLLHDRHNISVIPHEATHVLVVGDLHGDLASLSHIFNHHGPPTKTLAYVFNGDLIDRGPHSSELLFFVASLLELFPHRYIPFPPTHQHVYSMYTLEHITNPPTLLLDCFLLGCSSIEEIMKI